MIDSGGGQLAGVIGEADGPAGVVGLGEGVGGGQFAGGRAADGGDRFAAGAGGVAVVLAETENREVRFVLEAGFPVVRSYGLSVGVGVNLCDVWS